jgi:mannose-6-phosphate isomerase
MTKFCNYPLRFEPLFRRYLWGGRRLGTMLGKAIGSGDDYAESWELVDHGDDQSVVGAGALQGLTLHELVTQHGEQLFGRHSNQTQFPLLFKFLDCNRTLSVQVHPNDDQGALLDPPDLGKTEAWVVLAAEPGSKIYAGLKPGVTREQLAKAIEAGHCETCLHEFEPAVGDCVFIKAGTVHALGAGLVIAEIQQASDTTFRLFDWNRVDAEGKPRQLHITESLDVTDYDRGPVAPQQTAQTDSPERERLVECDKFVLDRLTISKPQTVGGDERFHLLVPLSGAITLAGDAVQEPLALGKTCLIPAAAGAVEIVPQGTAVVLDIYLP